jgi:hypothetical protein
MCCIPEGQAEHSFTITALVPIMTPGVSGKPSLQRFWGAEAARVRAGCSLSTGGASSVLAQAQTTAVRYFLALGSAACSTLLLLQLLL